MATSKEFLETMLQNENVQAALKCIRHTEGTSADDGYNYIFGSSPNNDLRFADMSQHPNDKQTHNKITSTAAGAYQILYSTYADLCEKYGFTDFEPHTQDLMCCAIFDLINVLTAVSKGLLLSEAVMTKISNQWASMPYSKYGQPTHTIADVREFYLSVGGTLG